MIVWEILINLMPVLFGVYVYATSRHIKRLEKKTLLLSEVGDAHNALIRIHNTVFSLKQRQLNISEKLKSKIIRLEKSLAECDEKLTNIYSSITIENHSVECLEETRALVQQVSRIANNIITETDNVENELVEISKRADELGVQL